MTKTEFVEHLKGLGDVYISYAPFTKQIEDFNNKGIKIVSVRDASYIRLHGNNRDYTRTCHAPVCTKDSPTIVARISPLIENLEMAGQAVDVHRNNPYCVFDNEKHIYAQFEKIAEEDKNKSPEERRAIILPEREDYRIHRDSDEAMFFWQGTRKDYFNKFVSGDTDTVPCRQISIDDVDSANGTIINYIGFSSPVVESGLCFRGRNLNNDIKLRALGVLRVC